MSMYGMAPTLVVGGSYGMCPTPRTGVLELKSEKKRWSAKEDQILLDQIKKHGARKWDKLRNVPGLNSRSGKSCRLRWLNHLRPNLKKGPFTEEEGHIVIQHQKIKEMRNKWTQIADRLPGRTDNDVKNYWNTKNKKPHVNPPAAMEQQWPSSSAMNQNVNDQYFAANTRHDELHDTPLQPVLDANQYVDVVIEPLPLPVNNIDTVSYAALLQNSSNAAMEIHQWSPSFAMNQTVNDHHVDVNMQHDMKDLSYRGSDPLEFALPLPMGCSVFGESSTPIYQSLPDMPLYSPDPTLTETLFSLCDPPDHYPMFDLSLFNDSEYMDYTSRS